jgi:hypothetical protein
MIIEPHLIALEAPIAPICIQRSSMLGLRLTNIWQNGQVTA